jgi:hypothetical protein
MGTPKFVTVTRSFTYDVTRALEDLKEYDGASTEADALEMIREWAWDDLRSPVSRHDIKYTDEAGNELVF